MKKQVYFSFLFLLLLISTNDIPVKGEPSNFELDIIYAGDKPLYDNVALNIEHAYASLNIKLNKIAPPRPNFLSRLVNKEFGLAIVSFESFRSDFPPIADIYSPESLIGQQVYSTNDTNLMSASGIDSNELITIINNYKNASTRQEKIKYASQFQDKNNNQWLFDIPLVSPAEILVAWNELSNLTPDEGLFKSLLLGMEWSTNPSTRSKISRSSSELHYLFDGEILFHNPLKYKNRFEKEYQELIYPSLLLMDGNNIPHPNLAKTFKKSLVDGNAEWTFNLRDDVFWSNNQRVTAKDVKFTIDMNRFDWISATNSESWNDLDRVVIVNDTTVKIIFNGDRYADIGTMGNELLVPEHILNSSKVDDQGIIKSIYTGSTPSEFEEWKDFELNPITSGLYDVTNIGFDGSIVLELNKNYWYPSELDNDVDNYYNNEKIDPYFLYDTQTKSKVTNLPIKKLVLYSGGKNNIDRNSARLTMENGGFDIMEFDFLSDGDEIFNNPNFSIFKRGISSNGIVILLNLNNDVLKDYSIRKALTLAIDRQKMDKIMGFGYPAQYTSVSQYFPEFYNASTALPYDFNEARTIFIDKGYFVPLSNTVVENVEYPWERVPFNNFTFIIALILIPITRRKFKQ